jgi:hypothetical protein
VGFTIAKCRLPIADWLLAQQTNWKSEIDNRKWNTPTRYREVVLTSSSLRLACASYDKLKVRRTQRFTIHDLPFTIYQKGHP